MNLLLHGLDAPNIDPGNALRFKLTEIGERDRVDVILTNPPFGGEEERGIQGNFPDDRQTAETALLFLQLVMRKLRRTPGSTGRPSRAAVIVPDGTLFDDGVSKRIREDLLKGFNLHTVVRLPFGVFAPYAKSVKTNILFFDNSKPTDQVWFFEHKVPDDRKNYSKTKPIEYEDFRPLQEWLVDRKPSDRAWSVNINQICDNDWNLDSKNPNGLEQLFHQPPHVLVKKIESNLFTIQRELAELERRLAGHETFRGKPTAIGDFADLVKRAWVPEPGTTVKSLGVKWWGKGAYVAETKPAENLQADRFLVQGGDLIYNDMWARHGSVAVVPSDLGGCVASAHFPTWLLDVNQVFQPYLTWCFRTPWFWAECESRSRGSTGRNAIRKGLFKQIMLPLPSIDQQQEIASLLTSHAKRIAEVTSANMNIAQELEALAPSVLEILLPPSSITTKIPMQKAS
jgi:type I restriction enzyme M protein